jgi:iron complex outermembrane receptor protein
MTTRFNRLAGISAAAIVASWAMPAMAQAPAAEAADTVDIVVTAQRVEQNLQDVPLAVTAVGGAALQRANITDATRLEILAPGLTIGRSGTDLRPAIRGVRTENVGANADPTIGFFIDGVYQSRPSQALAGFVDLERVEVLRGPQGTLFGRNTYGGAISLVSAKPTGEFSGAVNASYARFNRVRVDGHVNAPISDMAQFRIAAAYDRSDGYVRNIGGGGDLGKDDQIFVRPSLRLKSDTMELVLRASYWKQTGTAIGAFGYKSAGTMIDPALVSPTNSGRSLGIGAQLTPINTRVGDGIADINGYDLGVPIGSPYVVSFDNTNRVDNEMFQLTSDFSWDLGFATLRSITGFTDWYSLRSSDNDFSAFPLAVDFNVTDARTVSQEVQLFGKSASFEWILGGFYYSDRVYEIFFNDQNNAYPVAGSAAAAGPPFQTNPGYTARPALGGVLTGAPFALVRVDGITPVSVNTESLAGFAQATYRFSPAFAVTGGLRYTSDRKRYSRQLLNAVNLTLASADLAGFTQRNQTATFDRLTWKAGAEFKPAEDSLIYAQVSTGFTSGGFNGGTFTPPGGVLTPLPPFAPQTVTAYELGTKNRFAGGAIQINAALFYNDLKNLQVQSQVPFGSTVLSITGNAGAARSYGGELEAIFRPTRQITIGLNATYLNARYKTLLLNNPFPNPTQTCAAAANVGAAIPLRVGRLVCLNPGGGTTFVNQVDLAGARIPYSPEFTLQASFNWDIETGFGTIAPSANFLYNSGYFNTDFNTLVDEQKSFTKTDLRLTWTSSDKRFSAQVFVENLEDKAVNQRGVFGTNQSMNASYAPPRTYGVKLGARF